MTSRFRFCSLPYGFSCRWNYRRIAVNIGFTIECRHGDDLSGFPIEEARIQPVLPVTLAGTTAATIRMGIAAGINLAGLLVLLFLIGLYVPGSLSLLDALVVNLYSYAPATAVAASSLVAGTCRLLPRPVCLD